MIFPYIEFTETYNDESGEKYDRPRNLLTDLIESFTSFQITYNGEIINVKDDDKQIRRKIKKKLEDIEEDHIKGGTEED